MNQDNQTNTERSKASPDSMQVGSGLGKSDEDEDSIASGSPKNLLVVAIVVALLFFAGMVFYIAAILGDSAPTRDNWVTADAVLTFVASGVFYAGVLVGLGTVATVRSKGGSSRAAPVASLLSKAGAVLIIMGIAEAICIVGATHYGQGWQDEASVVAFRVGTRVFQAGVLAGLALICLRQSRRGGSRDEKKGA